ncbi:MULTISPECIES: hypothetical protein [unclassified Mesorhizobium]|nr:MULTISPECIES: hypothetical protein [unclassified Mesorhizobium]
MDIEAGGCMLGLDHRCVLRHEGVERFERLLRLDLGDHARVRAPPRRAPRRSFLG